MNLDDLISIIAKAFAPLWAALALFGWVAWQFSPLVGTILPIVGWYFLWKSVKD